jgi:hypothetical protein
MKRSGIKRVSSDPRKKAIAALDRAFSKMIRERDGIAGCISCGAAIHEAGHFIRREAMSTRWNPVNVNGQCIRCNHFLSGNLFEYAIGLEARYMKGMPFKLRAESKKMKTWEVKELEQLVAAAKMGSRVYNQVYNELYPLPESRTLQAAA